MTTSENYVKRDTKVFICDPDESTLSNSISYSFTDFERLPTNNNNGPVERVSSKLSKRKFISGSCSPSKSLSSTLTNERSENNVVCLQGEDINLDEIIFLNDDKNTKVKDVGSNRIFSSCDGSACPFKALKEYKLKKLKEDNKFLVHDKATFPCDNCNVKLPKENPLKKQIEQNYDPMNTESPANPKSQNKHNYTTCVQSFLFKADLNAHIETIQKKDNNPLQNSIPEKNVIPAKNAIPTENIYCEQDIIYQQNVIPLEDTMPEQELIPHVELIPHHNVNTEDDIVLPDDAFLQLCKILPNFDNLPGGGISQPGINLKNGNIPQQDLSNFTFQSDWISEKGIASLNDDAIFQNDVFPQIDLILQNDDVLPQIDLILQNDDFPQNDVFVEDINATSQITKPDKKHQHPLKDEAEDDDTAEDYTCNICLETFWYESELRAHREKFHKHKDDHLPTMKAEAYIESESTKEPPKKENAEKPPKKENVEEPPKKKRGRKPGSKNNTKEGSENAKESPKKKRGRPPGSKSKVKEGSENKRKNVSKSLYEKAIYSAAYNDDLTENKNSIDAILQKDVLPHNDVFVQNINVISQIKKPDQIQQHRLDDQIEDDEEDTMVEPPKKKRGRPPFRIDNALKVAAKFVAILNVSKNSTDGK